MSEVWLGSGVLKQASQRTCQATVRSAVLILASQANSRHLCLWCLRVRRILRSPGAGTCGNSFEWFEAASGDEGLSWVGKVDFCFLRCGTRVLDLLFGSVGRAARMHASRESTGRLTGAMEPSVERNRTLFVRGWTVLADLVAACVSRRRALGGNAFGVDGASRRTLRADRHADVVKEGGLGTRAASRLISQTEQLRLASAPECSEGGVAGSTTTPIAWGSGTCHTDNSSQRPCQPTEVHTANHLTPL